MRLFAVQPDGFREYGEQAFSAEHQERAIQAWMEHNPQAITDDGGLLIIGREVTTDLGAFIDLLGVDRAGNAVVVELKRGQPPRDTLAQALEYTAYVSTLGSDALESLYQSYSGEEGVSLASAHRQFFGLSDEDTVTFNKDQRMVLVAADVTPPIHASAEYLNRRGLRVSCLEFGYFRTSAGEELLSTDIVVDGVAQAATRPTSGPGPRVNKEAFLAACDESGRAVFPEILAMAEQAGFSIIWGTVGFSVGATLSGDKRYTIAYGYPCPARPGQNRQSLAVVLAYLLRELPQLADTIAKQREEFLSLGMFASSGDGPSVRWNLTQVPSNTQIRSATAALQKLVTQLRDAVIPLSDTTGTP